MASVTRDCFLVSLSQVFILKYREESNKTAGSISWLTWVEPSRALYNQAVCRHKFYSATSHLQQGHLQRREKQNTATFRTNRLGTWLKKWRLKKSRVAFSFAFKGCGLQSSSFWGFSDLQLKPGGKKYPHEEAPDREGESNQDTAVQRKWILLYPAVQGNSYLLILLLLHIIVCVWQTAQNHQVPATNA